MIIYLPSTQLCKNVSSLASVSPFGSVGVSPVNDTAENGDTSNFTCSADGGLNSIRVWIRGSTISSFTSGLGTGNNFNSTELLQRLIPTVSTGPLLSISSVNATEDGGSYTCVVVNQAGFDTASVVLYVRPLIVEHPQDQLTSVRENFTLSCRAESFPYPEYYWEKYNTTSQTYQPLPGESSNVLEFNEVQFSDYGVYRCVATAPVINVVAYSNNATVTGECKINYK